MQLWVKWRDIVASPCREWEPAKVDLVSAATGMLIMTNPYIKFGKISIIQSVINLIIIIIIIFFLGPTMLLTLWLDGLVLICWMRPIDLAFHSTKALMEMWVDEDNLKRPKIKIKQCQAIKRKTHLGMSFWNFNYESQRRVNFVCHVVLDITI